MKQNNDNNVETFRKMYNFMLGRNELETPEEKLLYMIVYNYPYQTFFGYQEHLADLIGVSVRTVRRVIDKLVEKGLLKKNVIWNPKISKRTVSYSITRKCEDGNVPTDYITEVIMTNEII